MTDKEFKINDFISLKLENKKTQIYVNGKRFLQCSRLVLNIPINEVGDYEQINSIDEAVDVNKKKTIWLNQIVQGLNARPDRIQEHDIMPEQEFWGHCSNLQMWYEENYDTCLLHSSLAFSLLRKLTKAGDPIAKETFKREIIKRFNNGYPSVINYLIEENYLKYLGGKEILQIIEPLLKKFSEINTIDSDQGKLNVILNVIDAIKGTKEIEKNFNEVFNNIKKLGVEIRSIPLIKLVHAIKGTKLIEEKISEILSEIEILPDTDKIGDLDQVINSLTGTGVINKKFGDFLNLTQKIGHRWIHEKGVIMIHLIREVKGTEVLNKNFTNILKYGFFGILIKEINGSKLVRKRFIDLLTAIEEIDAGSQYSAFCMLIKAINDNESNTINSRYDLNENDKRDDIKNKPPMLLRLILAIQQKEIMKKNFSLILGFFEKLSLKHMYWIILQLIDNYKGTAFIKELFPNVVNGIKYQDNETKFEIFIRLILAIKGSDVIREDFAYFLRELEKSHSNINFKDFSKLILTIEGFEVIRKKYINMLIKNIKFSIDQIKKESYMFFVRFIDNLEESKTREQTFTTILNGLDKIPWDLRFGAFSILIEAIKGPELLKNNTIPLLNVIEELGNENKYPAYCELLNEIKKADLLKDKFSELLKGMIYLFETNWDNEDSIFRELTDSLTQKDLEDAIFNFERTTSHETFYYFLDKYISVYGNYLEEYLNTLYDKGNDKMINLIIKSDYIHEQLTQLNNKGLFIDLLGYCPEPVVNYILEDLNYIFDRYESEEDLMELIDIDRYSVIEYIFESDRLNYITSKQKDSIISYALSRGNSSVMYYLINKGYFNNIPIDEIESIYINSNLEGSISSFLRNQSSKKRLDGPLVPLELLRALVDMGSIKAKAILLEELKKIIERNSEILISYLEKNGFLGKEI